MKRLPGVIWFAILTCTALGWLRAAEERTSASAEKKAEGAGALEEATKFLRLRRDDDKRPLAMETAVAHYVSEKRPGVSVDLVGAVHVGDESYYEALNKLFTKYDVVLYELVAPEGTRVPKGGRKGPSTHPVGALQDGMSSILELKHQLNCVDYTQKNLVHADMSPEDFSKAMEQRGESFLQMFLQLMGTGLAQKAGGGGMDDASVLFALFSPNRAEKLKALMAEQFESLDGQLAVLDGPDGSAILTERNKRCIEELDKELTAGQKKIAIFYGAAHLPDMERRLTSDYGFRRENIKWLPAWQLKAGTAPGAAGDKP
jgi:hypothetical protein